MEGYLALCSGDYTIDISIRDKNGIWIPQLILKVENIIALPFHKSILFPL